MQRSSSHARLQQLARTFSRGNFEELGRFPHVLIGATGSVACVKLPILIKKIFELERDEVEIKVVATKSALHFLKKEDIDPRVEIYHDEDEWTWEKISDPVLHIELRNWTDVLLIVPLDANSLAKIAGGICDNLLTSIVRAWNFSESTQKPVIACPAMNTQMWLHPFTAKHINILKNELNFLIINPVSKKLACGDYGMGALASVDTISEHLHTFLVEWNNVKDNKLKDDYLDDKGNKIMNITNAVDRLKIKSMLPSQLSNSYLSDYK